MTDSKLTDVWENPWWLKPEWRSQIRLSDSELGERINLLRYFFPREWVSILGDDPLRHPLVRSLCLEESTSQIRSILELADQICTLKDVPGFQGVLKSYRRIDTAKSAQFEMFMAWVMSRAGYIVEFITPGPNKGKTPDIHVLCESGHSFVIECKFLMDAATERWIDAYQIAFQMQLWDATPKGIGLYYDHYDDIEIREYGHPDALCSPEIAAFVDLAPVIAAINHLLAIGAVPGFTRVAGKGDLGLFCENEHLRSQHTVPELNQRQLFHRLFGGGVQKAANQIRSYGVPGIVAVFQAQPAAFDFIESQFMKLVNSEREQYAPLMGLLVFPAQNILQYVRPLWVQNPYAVLDAANFNVPNTLAHFFDIQIRKPGT